MPTKKTDTDAELLDAKPERIRVKAISPIRYDGKTYGPNLPDGDELDVSPAERDELQAVGALADGEPS